MIALVALALRERWGQALTVLVLSFLATVAAVAGPSALAAVDGAVIGHEVAAADPAERSIRLSWRSTGPLDATDVLSGGPVPRELDGFQQVYSAQFPVLGVSRVAAVSRLAALTFREDVCAHLTMVRGRCTQGAYEVVIGADTATRYGHGPGSVLRTDEVAITMFGEVLPRDNPRTLMVVGVYRPSAPSDVYWGPRGFGNTGAGEREPVFADRATVGYANAWGQTQSIDVILPAGLLTPASIGTVRRGVDLTRATAPPPDVTFEVTSQVPALLDRIEAGQRVAHALLPVAFVPLVALCLYVMYLAVAYSTAGRRHELGLVAVRGVTSVRRTWLAVGEPLAMILTGAPIGYLVGSVAVARLAAWRFDQPAATGAGATALLFAAGAVLASAAVCLLAQRRERRASAAELLRDVPPRPSVTRTAVVEVVAVVLAIVAAVQLRGAGAGLAGVASLAPGLVIVAVALLAARALIPVAGRLSRIALRRGRLGSALAAIQVARRPGNHRLLVLLTVATALLGFAVAGLDVAARARHDRAAIQTGAPTVVTVDPVDARTLLAVVRSVDPAGAFAMSAAQAPPAARNAPPVLAVDAARLATVAAWRSRFGVEPARLAALLRPAAPPPFVLRGTGVGFDLEDPADADGGRHTFVMTFAPLAGGPAVDAVIDGLAPGRRLYTVPVTGCAAGCRVVSLRAVTSGEQPVSVTLRAVRTVGREGATGDVVPAADLVDAARWRSGTGTLVEPQGDGLKVTGGPAAATGADSVPASDAQPVDAPVPLPVATAGTGRRVGTGVVGFDQGMHEAAVVARPTALPRVGSSGTFVDLEYLDRTTLRPTTLAGAQVWLGPAAPPDAVERLRRAGLPVTGVIRADEQERALARQGPALVLWFHVVAAVLGLLLGTGAIALMAAVDHRRHADGYRFLRWQGLSRRDVRRATRRGGLGLVVAGGVLGAVATWLAWLVTGDRLPVFVDDDVLVAPPRWPAVAAVLWPCAAATALLAMVALVAAGRVRRAAARNNALSR